jgi:hypothetical protein
MLQLATAADAEDRTVGLSSQWRSLVYLIDPHARRASLPASTALYRASFRWRLDCDGHALTRQPGGNTHYLPLFYPITIKLANFSRSVPLARQCAKRDRMIRYASIAFYHLFLNFFL